MAIRLELNEIVEFDENPAIDPLNPLRIDRNVNGT
jgi:hypothetical protein